MIKGLSLALLLSAAFGHETSKPISDFSTHGVSTCQFVYQLSVYNYLSVSTPTYYETTNVAGEANAFFTYCYNLGLTTLNNGCEGGYYATIRQADGTCVLNADFVEMSGFTPANSTTDEIALVYTNTDAATNGGVSTLTVVQTCDATLSAPVTGTLELTD